MARNLVATLSVVSCVLVSAPFPGSAQGAPVVLHHPATGDVVVESGVVYGEHGDQRLTLDLYYPPDARPEPDSALAAVVFVLAFPDSTLEVPLKDYGQYTSWARLVAAEGMVGVVYEVADPVRDLRSVMGHLRREAGHLGIDPQRVALWSCSGNTGLALHQLRTDPAGVRALVAYYGVMPTPDGFQAAAIDSIAARYSAAIPRHEPGEAYPDDVPLLVARAGQDRWTTGLATTDHFVAFALEQNLPVTVINHPAGQHAFDVLDNTPESRRIIRRTLGFLGAHLWE